MFQHVTESYNDQTRQRGSKEVPQADFHSAQRIGNQVTPLMRYLGRHQNKVRTATAHGLFGQRKRGQVIGVQNAGSLKVKKWQVLPHGILKHYMRAIIRKYRFKVCVSRWWAQNRRNTGSGKC